MHYVEFDTHQHRLESESSNGDDKILPTVNVTRQNFHSYYEKVSSLSKPPLFAPPVNCSIQSSETNSCHNVTYTGSELVSNERHVSPCHLSDSLHPRNVKLQRMVKSLVTTKSERINATPLHEATAEKNTSCNLKENFNTDQQSPHEEEKCYSSVMSSSCIPRNKAEDEEEEEEQVDETCLKSKNDDKTTMCLSTCYPLETLSNTCRSPKAFHNVFSIGDFVEIGKLEGRRDILENQTAEIIRIEKGLTENQPSYVTVSLCRVDGSRFQGQQNPIRKNIPLTSIRLIKKFHTRISSYHQIFKSHVQNIQIHNIHSSLNQSTLSNINSQSSYDFLHDIKMKTEAYDSLVGRHFKKKSSPYYTSNSLVCKPFTLYPPRTSEGVLCFFWDLEATGLKTFDDDITQIACVCRRFYFPFQNMTSNEIVQTIQDSLSGNVNSGRWEPVHGYPEKDFNCYVYTDRIIPEPVVNLTGITNEFLEKHGVSIQQAVRNWATWVSSATQQYENCPVWFVAHNGNQFDLPLLFHQEVSKLGQPAGAFLASVGAVGIVDTVVLSRRLAWGNGNIKQTHRSHKLQTLYFDVFHQTMPNEHDALGDVLGLAKLMNQDPFLFAWSNRSVGWSLSEYLVWSCGHSSCMTFNSYFPLKGIKKIESDSFLYTTVKSSNDYHENASTKDAIHASQECLSSEMIQSTLPSSQQVSKKPLSIFFSSIHIWDSESTSCKKTSDILPHSENTNEKDTTSLVEKDVYPLKPSVSFFHSNKIALPHDDPNFVNNAIQSDMLVMNVKKETHDLKSQHMENTLTLDNSIFQNISTQYYQENVAYGFPLPTTTPFPILGTIQAMSEPISLTSESVINLPDSSQDVIYPSLTRHYSLNEKLPLKPFTCTSTNCVLESLPTESCPTLNSNQNYSCTSQVPSVQNNTTDPFINPSSTLLKNSLQFSKTSDNSILHTTLPSSSCTEEPKNKFSHFSYTVGNDRIESPWGSIAGVSRLKSNTITTGNTSSEKQSVVRKKKIPITELPVTTKPLKSLQTFHNKWQFSKKSNPHVSPEMSFTKQSMNKNHSTSLPLASYSLESQRKKESSLYKETYNLQLTNAVFPSIDYSVLSSSRESKNRSSLPTLYQPYTNKSHLKKNSKCVWASSFKSKPRCPISPTLESRLFGTPVPSRSLWPVPSSKNTPSNSSEHTTNKKTTNKQIIKRFALNRHPSVLLETPVEKKKPYGQYNKHLKAFSKTSILPTLPLKNSKIGTSSDVKGMSVHSNSKVSEENHLKGQWCNKEYGQSLIQKSPLKINSTNATTSATETTQRSWIHPKLFLSYDDQSLTTSFSNSTTLSPNVTQQVLFPTSNSTKSPCQRKTTDQHEQKFSNSSNLYSEAMALNHSSLSQPSYYNLSEQSFSNQRCNEKALTNTLSPCHYTLPSQHQTVFTNTKTSYHSSPPHRPNPLIINARTTLKCTPMRSMKILKRGEQDVFNTSPGFQTDLRHLTPHHVSCHRPTLSSPFSLDTSSCKKADLHLNTTTLINQKDPVDFIKKTTQFKSTTDESTLSLR